MSEERQDVEESSDRPLAAGRLGELRVQLQRHFDRVQGEVLGVSRKIHARPELRFEERFASSVLADSLADHGFQVERGVGGMPTAFKATVRRGDPGEGPNIAVFCEYDALEGLGHGCGHNLIAAAGLGAGLIAAAWLKERSDAFGQITVLGSPGEEGGGGKIRLSDAGLLHGVQAAMMVHPGPRNCVHQGWVGRANLEFEFRGVASHAATAPERGVNALDAASLTLVAIGLLRQQLRDGSRIHSIIVDGGAAPNIIPDRAVVNCYVRSPDSEYLHRRLIPAVISCVQGAALATGTSAEVREPFPTYEPVVSNVPLLTLFEESMLAVGRGPIDTATHANRREVSSAGMGSTDMGNISGVVPAIHPHMELLPDINFHSHEMAAASATPSGDRFVGDASLAMSMTIVELLRRPELVSDMAQWHRIHVTSAAD